jgi:hypothetical protein
MDHFVHQVEIDEQSRRLLIYRVSGSGVKSLFTETPIPRPRNEDPDGFDRFARILGENLLIDSPVARKLLGL